MSEALRESLIGMLKIHRLMMRGQDDSQDADELREAMFGPWDRMTEDEQEIVREVSRMLSEFSNELKKEPQTHVTAFQSSES